MNPTEFASRCCLLCLRWSGSVTSWGRTETRNTTVNGVPGSYHLDWLGMDVVLDNQKKNLPFERSCSLLGISALYEGDHYHLQPKNI